MKIKILPLNSVHQIISIVIEKNVLIRMHLISDYVIFLINNPIIIDYAV